MELLNVLLIEDNPGDVRLVKEALIESNLQLNLIVIMDGAEAIEYLFKKGDFKEVPSPDFIILDLNLPKKDGREILSIIKENEDLKTIPVLVLTTSSNHDDIMTTYNHHGNCYVTKPIDFEDFIEVVTVFSKFWFTIVKLPKRRIKK